MLAMVVIIVVVLAASALAFYAMHRSKPSHLKLSASLLKLVSFSIEVESKDDRQKDELPSGRHHRRLPLARRTLIEAASLRRRSVSSTGEQHLQDFRALD
jgi:hypothetical protein